MRPLTSIATFVAWHRRAIAALCAGLAVYLVAHQLLIPPELGTPVVVLAQEVGPGHRLTADDLHLERIPETAVPDHAATEVAPVLGKTVALPLPRGTVVQPALLASSRTIEPGRALVPIVVGDERLLSVLRAGDRVSLVVGTGDVAEPVTSDARISGLPGDDQGGTMSVGGSRGALVMVDVPEAEAAAVAMLGQSGQLGLVIAPST
ncbi:SAF domain-containing protein [Tessaracoccus caeni]|uniref:SAF domain-containing protein n=1 Tax=Tessaracoccus caeni TaxID=3031239 RepID=UPI0023DCD6BD|nr:SAF domain-containing protein [Tessaracoccus caeni]MDF1490102.1 SAF domain-containing protein [Tessaracoccus caeni]